MTSKIRILLIIALCLVPQIVRAEFLGVKKVTEPIIFQINGPIDTLGRQTLAFATPDHADSITVFTYLDDGTFIAWDSGGAAYACPGVDTTMRRGKTEIWFNRKIHWIDGTPADSTSYTLAVTVWVWEDGYYRETNATVQVVADSLDQLYTVRDTLNVYDSDSRSWGANVLKYAGTAQTPAVTGFPDVRLIARGSDADTGIVALKAKLTTIAGYTDDIGVAGAGLTAADDAMITAIADVPTVAEFEARTIVSANYFDPAVDSVFADKSSLADLNIKVNSADTIGINWAAVANPTATVGLSSTTVNLVTTTTTATTVQAFSAGAITSTSFEDEAITGAALAPSAGAEISDSVWKAGVKTMQAGNADSTFADAFINTGGQAYAIIDHDTSGGTIDSNQVSAGLHRKLAGLDTVLIHAPHGNNFASTSASSLDSAVVSRIVRRMWGIQLGAAGSTDSTTIAQRTVSVDSMLVGSLNDLGVSQTAADKIGFYTWNMGDDSAGWASGADTSFGRHLNWLNPDQDLDADLVTILGSSVSTTTAQLGVNIVQVSTDATAADNMELDYDGTGYDNLTTGEVDAADFTAGAIDDGAVNDGAIDWGEELDTLGVHKSSTDSATTSRIVGRKTWGLETSGSDSSTALQRKVNLALVADSSSVLLNFRDLLDNEIDSVAILDVRLFSARSRTGDAAGYNGAFIVYGHGTGHSFDIRADSATTAAMKIFNGAATYGTAVGALDIGASGSDVVHIRNTGTAGGSPALIAFNPALGVASYLALGVGNGYLFTGPSSASYTGLFSDPFDAETGLGDLVIDSVNLATSFMNFIRNAPWQADTNNATWNELLNKFGEWNAGAQAATGAGGSGNCGAGSQTVTLCVLDTSGVDASVQGAQITLYTSAARTAASIYANMNTLTDGCFPSFNLNASTTYYFSVTRVGYVFDTNNFTTGSGGTWADTIYGYDATVTSPAGGNLKRVYVYFRNGAIPIAGAELKVELKGAQDSTGVPYDSAAGGIYAYGIPIVDTGLVTNVSGYAHCDIPLSSNIKPNGSRWIFTLKYRGQTVLGPYEVNATTTTATCLQAATGTGTCP